jgi:hypothetical protein
VRRQRTDDEGRGQRNFQSFYDLNEFAEGERLNDLNDLIHGQRSTDHGLRIVETEVDHGYQWTSVLRD